MVDPDTIADVLPECREHHEQASEPIRERLALVKNALIETEWPLERLLDLYLTEDITKEASSERHVQLQDRVAVLEGDPLDLHKGFEDPSVTEKRVATIRRVAPEGAEGLSRADDHRKTRRKIITLLESQVRAHIKADRKVLDIEYQVGEGRVSTAFGST